MPVHLQILDPSHSQLAPPLRRLLALLRIRQGHWSITLVGDPEMAGLHRRTLGIPTTTDVLTFDLRDHTQNSKFETQKSRNLKLETRSSLDLDTVISLDVARRRAHELRHPLRHELLLYCLHSLLHVQGHNDITPALAQRMHAREDELLAAVGIGPIYSRPVKNQKSKIKKQKSRRAP